MGPSIGFNKVLVLLFGLLSIHWADAQDCTIIFPEHTNTEIKERAYRNMAQTDKGLSSWTSLENGILQDRNYINLDLAPQEVSETLQLSDFRLNIPEGSEIHGLSLILKGKSDVAKPTDVRVQLVNPEPIGRDLANIVFAGTSWPTEDGEWRYGSSWYNWELNLTAELLNSPDFGLNLSIENNGSESISAQLDKITIQVKYTPPYTICIEHACIIGSIQNSPSNTSYDWQIPTDFEVISDTDNEDVIVISPIVPQPGLFELCATPQGSGMEPCCALFRMKDCRSADIGDYVWQDVNGNGIQDMDEMPLGGVSISLFDPLANLVAQTVSDENGFYQFLDIPTDEYYIQVGLPDGYVFSPADVSSDDIDSDISGILGTGTSDLFMVLPAQDITNLDIGVVPLYEITGTLWEDLDADGVRAVGEPLVNGIQIYLIDAMNNVVASTNTDNQGTYQFEDLLQGDYTISVNLPGKTFVSPQDVGNDAFDSDFNLFGNLDVFGLSQNMVFDLGMYRKARIGDFIWLDQNRDGQFGSGDNGLENIVVKLLDLNGNLIDSQVTESGNYNFNNIVPGDYRLDISVGPDYIHTLLSSINAPLNFNGSTYTTTVTLISGEMNLDLDFGFQYAPSSISGYAWLDNNGDGFSAGESNISDVEVDLFMASGQFIASTVTDSDGEYIFDTLNPGSYYVVFTQPSGLVTTVLNGDSTVENDIVDGATDLIWLQANTNITDINAGYFAYSTIGDYIWLDTNRNGLQDIDESGIPNLSLRLIDLNTNLFFFGSTDADGYYSFSFLSPGNYSLSISDTDDIQATIADAGNGSNDSRPINEYTGDDASEVIVINSGTTIDNLDFGYQNKPSSISGYTWIDLNADGVDNSEEKLAGVDVSLWTLGGAFVSTTTTGTDGTYSFNDLNPGAYYLTFTAEQDYQYTSFGLDSDVDQVIATGSTTQINIAADQDINGIDAGFYKYASVGDYIWIDADKNGIQDATEDILTEVTVTLINETTGASSATITDLNGRYLFTDLVPGSYSLQVAKTATLVPTQVDAGNGFNDSRALTDAGNVYASEVFELVSDLDDRSRDFGFQYMPSSISGFTWVDLNADGNFDNAEPFKEGTPVILNDGLGNFIASAVTDADGYYVFNDLLPGDYYVLFGQGAFQYSPSSADNSIVNSQFGSTDLIMLSADQNLLDINGAFYQFASVGDYVWIDTDNDGIQDVGEEGLSQVTVILQDLTTNIPITQITDQEGAYLFKDVLPGNYRISIGKNALYAPTTSDSGNGTDDSRDLIDSGSVYAGSAFNLISNQNERNQDYGFKFLSSSISGITWFDYNADGSFDSGEPIKTGTVVNLLDANNVSVATTTTDNDGNYLFDDLVPGEYYVSFGLEPNLLFSPVGPDNAVTGILGIGSTAKIILAPDQNLTNISAGYFAYSSIGDYLWLDSNADGIQDNTESGIANVMVSLFDDNATLVDQVTTDDDGQYTFVNLLPADYYLVFNYASNLNSTNANAGNGQNDSDIIDVFGPGSTGIFSLGFMQDITDIDGGVINVEGSISGEVFIDGDANGINEMMDMPYPSVGIELYSSLGVLIAQTSTAMDGSYNFSQVMPGNYYVQFIVPSGFVITAADQGVSNMIDSDVTGTNGIGTTETFNLPVMGAIEDIDMGIYQYATIGDMVWIDVDDNAVFSNSEDGLENVVISLINQNGSVIDMKTTGADGLYCFTDVVPGVYQVKFEMPPNYSFVTPDVGTNESIDSDANNASGNLGFTNPFMVASGVSMKDIDAGVVFSGLGVISGLAWEDLNGDGIQQDLEPLEEGVIVELYNEQNLLLNSVITAADGFYQFTSVPLGNVYLVFNADVDEIITTADAGMDDLIDSDVTGSVVDHSTDLIAITANATIQNVNVGIYRYASIGDRVWLDANENGLLDMGEEGVNGVNIELFDMNGTLISTTMSMSVNGVDGSYLFSNIIPGDYRVSFSLGGNLVFTQAFVGNDPTIDSDVVANGTAIGTTPALSIGSAEINNNIDAGVTELGDLNLSGFAFTDEKGNGVKDISDTYENGITVNLYTDAAVLIDTKVTATDVNGNPGFYSFDNVPMGVYYLEFVLPNDAEATDPDQGTNDGLDSDVTGANGPGTTDLIDLASASSTNQICAGFFYRGYIGNFIWNDVIPNGIQDPSELGLTDIMVSLFDESGNGVDATFSGYDINGNPGFYTFFNLKPGNYYVTFNNSPGIAFVDADQGSNDDLDSDVTNAFGFGTTDLICVTSGAMIENVDAGMQLETAEVGDYVWTDLNGNGVQNAGEPGLEGVRVDLYDEFDNYIRTEFSNAQGEYLFEDVQPGNYYLVFVAPSQYTVSEAYQGGDDTNDSDVMEVIAPGATNIFNLSPGEADMDIDAGFYIPSRIGDFVWDDLNKNGIQDAGEPGMENIEVDLRIGTSFILQSTVTDANGFYQFDGLKQGTYAVIFSNLPSGYVFSPMDATANDMLDSDANPSNGETSLIVLSHGVDFMELDAGVYKNNFSDFDRFEMRSWPQPTQRYVTHEIVSPFETPVKWTISTMNGQIVAYGTPDDIIEGKNEFTIDLKDIPAGKYVIRYDFRGFYKTQSLVKF